MKILIIDTNLVFSAILNPRSKIGTFILQEAGDRVEFFAPTYLREEMEKHFDRLIEITTAPPETMHIIMMEVYQRIHFINDALIPFEHYHTALPLVRNIDMNDIAFVALNEYLDELLWTGDMQLYNGLKAKGYDKVLNFEEVKAYLDRE